jgi:prepilin-type processing-associated H-X9-DG protein
MRRAFSLIELMIVCGIIMTLAAISASVYGSARGKAWTASCLSNQSQLAKAQLLYAADNTGGFACSLEREDQFWFGQLKPYGATIGMSCPAKGEPPRKIYWPRTGYSMNKCVRQDPAAQNSARMVMFTEVGDGWASRSGITYPIFPLEMTAPDIYAFNAETGPTFGIHYSSLVYGATRHGGGSNYSFVDGHSRWYRPESIRHSWNWFECVPPRGRPEDWRGHIDGPAFRNLP